MSISKCVVRLKDAHDTEHSATVYAETLYEAVLRGLKLLEDVGWESDRNETIKHVEVEIHREPTPGVRKLVGRCCFPNCKCKVYNPKS